MGGESEVFRAWDQATKSQKRTDLKKIMILGAGPIVIGQVRARDDALADGRRGERRGMGGGDRERERGRVFKYSNRGGGDREGATRAGSDASGDWRERFSENELCFVRRLDTGAERLTVVRV